MTTHEIVTATVIVCSVCALLMHGHHEDRVSDIEWTAEIMEAAIRITEMDIKLHEVREHSSKTEHIEWFDSPAVWNTEHGAVGGMPKIQVGIVIEEPDIWENQGPCVVVWRARKEGE